MEGLDSVKTTLWVEAPTEVHSVDRNGSIPPNLQGGLTGAIGVSRCHLQRRRTREGRKLDVGRRWIAAQEAFRGQSFYPDANSTLRVSIATVKSYEPRDGVHRLPAWLVLRGWHERSNGVRRWQLPCHRWGNFSARLHDVPARLGMPFRLHRPHALRARHDRADQRLRYVHKVRGRQVPRW